VYPLTDKMADRHSLLKSEITLSNLSRSIHYAIQRHEMWQQLSTANVLLAQKK